MPRKALSFLSDRRAIVADRFAPGVSGIRTSFYRIVRFRLLVLAGVGRPTHELRLANRFLAELRGKRLLLADLSRHRGSHASRACGRFHSLHKTRRVIARSRPRSALATETDFVRYVMRTHAEASMSRDTVVL